jgi:hypothetical protein
LGFISIQKKEVIIMRHNSGSFGSVVLFLLTIVQTTSTSIYTQRHIQETTNDVQSRSVLFVRILEDDDDPEDTSTTESIHTQLNSILFNGNTTYMTITAPNGQVFNTTGISVQEQMIRCSLGTVVLSPLSNHNNGHIWDIIVSSSSVTDRSDRSQWISAVANTAYTLGYLTNDENNENDRTPGLRMMADHVIVILPPNYSNQDEFVASAEVNNTISVFLSTVTTSLSMYMHELGHNIGLQHSGGINPEQVYGDKTGYMGTSDGSSYFPHKCYNAAQHWQLNWYNQYHISLVGQLVASRSSKWSGRLQLNAFVDATKLDGNNNNFVLVQIDTNTYLQFNRAKSYNIGTPMLIDEIAIVRDLGSNTQLLKGLNMTSYNDATYQYKSTITNPNNNQSTIKTKIMIQLCDLIIHNTTETTNDGNSIIDYAIVAIGFNKDDNTLCQSNFITSTTYTGNGPMYLTNSTANNGHNINLDKLFTNLYEVNVLLLILIGCTIVFVIGWVFKLLFRGIIYYCCCGCKCCTKNTDSEKDTTIHDGESTSIPGRPPSYPWQQQHQPAISSEQHQQQIPQQLPKQFGGNTKKGWFNRLFVTRRRNHRQQQRDNDSAETSPSHTSAKALPHAIVVQIY